MPKKGTGRGNVAEEGQVPTRCWGISKEAARKAAKGVPVCRIHRGRQAAKREKVIVVRNVDATCAVDGASGRPLIFKLLAP